MKFIICFYLFFFLLLGHNGFAQKEPISYPSWQHPILQALDKRVSNLVTLSHHKEDDYYVPLAILDKKNHKLYYINTFGSVFDSILVGPNLLKQLAGKTINAFDVYTKLVTAEGIGELEAVRNLLRTKAISVTKLIPKTTYFDYSSLKKCSSTLEQMMLLDNLEKFAWQKHILINLVLKEKPDSSFGAKKSYWQHFRPAKLILYGQHPTEYIEYTNSNRFSSLSKAILKPATATVFLYNQDDTIVDSFVINKTKLNDFTEEKHDIFALYRVWLEYQLQHANSRIESLLTGNKIKAVSLSTKDPRGQINSLLNYSSFIRQKILYATKPDKNLLLIHLLEQCKTQKRKQWSVAQEAWTDVEMPAPRSLEANSHTFIRGKKEYFLTDHRGNILVTINDRKMQVDSNRDGIVDYYLPDVVTATDYTPFGSMKAGRTYRNQGQQLKYGYNGKENDNEVKSEGNQQDYGMRIYDPRLGKFLSVDPLQKKYPELTPYQFSSNSPIQGVDLDGLEIYHYTLLLVDGKNPVLTYYGAQYNEPAWWEFMDKGKTKGFESYNGDKILTKSIAVHTITAEGNGIANAPPSLSFRYFKELFDWEAAGFPGSPGLSKQLKAHQRQMEDAVFVATVTQPQTSPAAKAKSLSSAEDEVILNRSPSSNTNKQVKAATTGRQLTTEETANAKGGTNLTYYRGGNSMKMSPADINNSVTKSTGMMKERGISINTDKKNYWIQQKGGAYEIDLNTMPKELKIRNIPEGGTHFEITPQQGGTMTVEQYQQLLNQIKLKPYNKVN